MIRRMCVGALVLSILVSLAMLPAAVNRLVDDVRALAAFDLPAPRIEAR